MCLMQQNERFMVRTVTLVDSKFIYENTIAQGRPEAIRQAERIGQIDKDDHNLVRSFLEGHLPEKTHKSLELLARGDDGYNAATIYQID